MNKARWRLDGQTALITGGTAGIGRAIAQEMLDLGADVLLVARDDEGLEQTQAELEDDSPGRTVHVFAADVARGEERLALFDWIEDRGLELQILVNNAGTNVSRAAMDYAEDEWRAIFETNQGEVAQPLARRAGEVVGVEGMAGMVARASENARANGLANVAFHQADLSRPLAEARWARGGFPAVLLDPPRDGALEMVRQLETLGARRVLYVSCNPATLARDAAELAARGYRLRRAGVLDMFPQTAHVEAMALFVRDPA